MIFSASKPFAVASSGEAIETDITSAAQEVNDGDVVDGGWWYVVGLNCKGSSSGSSKLSKNTVDDVVLVADTFGSSGATVVVGVDDNVSPAKQVDVGMEFDVVWAIVLLFMCDVVSVAVLVRAFLEVSLLLGLYCSEAYLKKLTLIRQCCQRKCELLQ